MILLNRVILVYLDASRTRPQDDDVAHSRGATTLSCRAALVCFLWQSYRDAVDRSEFRWHSSDQPEQFNLAGALAATLQ
jgi:hypothetical protein